MTDTLTKKQRSYVMSRIRSRWTKQERSIRERADLQASILENCSRLLRPGGVLVYATCTTEPEENEDIVRSFLSRAAEFSLDDPRPDLPEAAAQLVGDDLFFRTFPAHPAMDGFFAARLKRTSRAGVEQNPSS